MGDGPMGDGTMGDTIATYIHGRTPGPAWFATAPRISPYRRRLWAKLSTGSDFAVIRKHGCASHQLVQDGYTNTHTRRRSARVLRVRVWCHEAGTSHPSPGSSMRSAGRPHTATDCMPQGAVRAAAGDALQDCVVAFYAKAMAIRYNKSKPSSGVSRMSKAAGLPRSPPSQIRPGHRYITPSPVVQIPPAGHSPIPSSERPQEAAPLQSPCFASSA
jgi:hypothetical protein